MPVTRRFFYSLFSICENIFKYDIIMYIQANISKSLSNKYASLNMTSTRNSLITLQRCYKIQKLRSKSSARGVTKSFTPAFDLFKNSAALGSTKKLQVL